MREVRRRPDGGADAVRVRDVAAAADLPGRARGRRVRRCARGWRARCRSGSLAASGKAGLGARRAGGGARRARRAGALLRAPVTPTRKLDLVAVPSFGAGAMENAGLITFREERLLLDEHASLAARIGMASIIAHERGPPVVRRPGDDGVVGRPVAERGVRQLHGRRDRRRLAARDRRPPAGAGHQVAGDGRRFAGDRAPHPPAGAQHQRGAGGVRFGDLRQGPRGAGDDRGVARAGRVSRRPARLPAAPRVGQRHRRGSVRGARARRAAGATSRA